MSLRQLTIERPLHVRNMSPSSPRARAVVPASEGVIVGKAALASYWREALGKSPQLHFTLDATYVGVDAITLAYRNHRGEHVAETLVFDPHGHIARVVVTHRPGAPH